MGFTWALALKKEEEKVNTNSVAEIPQVLLIQHKQHNTVNPFQSFPWLDRQADTKALVRPLTFNTNLNNSVICCVQYDSCNTEPQMI